MSKSIIAVSLDSALIVLIDNKRGLIPRSRLIEEILLKEMNKENV